MTRPQAADSHHHNNKSKGQAVPDQEQIRASLTPFSCVERRVWPRCLQPRLRQTRQRYRAQISG
ncbi:hypothetical protein FH972_023826 [Carpinus fangiana]|uniref:Uncharacterized protein n=1 Tax=Carpinus fangiana TaxID=176857 RepID=A0A5N6KX31_9ROSI|nr:hypothetical protein FH972_023826 [Carpinus fangiana]